MRARNDDVVGAGKTVRSMSGVSGRAEVPFAVMHELRCALPRKPSAGRLSKSRSPSPARTPGCQLQAPPSPPAAGDGFLWMLATPAPSHPRRRRARLPQPPAFMRQASPTSAAPRPVLPRARPSPQAIREGGDAPPFRQALSPDQRGNRRSVTVGAASGRRSSSRSGGGSAQRRDHRRPASLENGALPRSRRCRRRPPALRFRGDPRASGGRVRAAALRQRDAATLLTLQNARCARSTAPCRVGGMRMLSFARFRNEHGAAMSCHCRQRLPHARISISTAQFTRRGDVGRRRDRFVCGHETRQCGFRSASRGGRGRSGSAGGDHACIRTCRVPRRPSALRSERRRRAMMKRCARPADCRLREWPSVASSARSRGVGELRVGALPLTTGLTTPLQLVPRARRLLCRTHEIEHGRSRARIELRVAVGLLQAPQIGRAPASSVSIATRIAAIASSPDLSPRLVHRLRVPAEGTVFTKTHRRDRRTEAAGSPRPSATSLAPAACTRREVVLLCRRIPLRALAVRHLRGALEAPPRAVELMRWNRIDDERGRAVSSPAPAALPCRSILLAEVEEGQHFGDPVQLRRVPPLTGGSRRAGGPGGVAAHRLEAA